jgi:hypothetical protein
LALTLLAAAPAAADVFTVRGVQVDETAGSAAEAKTKAVAAAQLIAAERLIDRLTLPEDRASAPPLDNAAASRLVQGYQVDEEKVTGQRYIGRLTITFRGNAVRQFLDSASVPYITSSAQPVVVVPLYRDGGGTRLWDNNPWLTAWSIAGAEDELVPVITPSGDVNDISAADAGSAAALNRTALEQLAGNYGSTHVLVAIASPAGEGKVTVTMKGIDFGRGGEIKDYGSLGVGDPVEQAHKAADLLQDTWKRAMIVPNTGATQQAQVDVLFSSLGESQRLQQIINQEPLIVDKRLDAATTDGTLYLLTFRGTPEQLQLALREHGADLARNPDGSGWTIRSLGAGSGTTYGQ